MSAGKLTIFDGDPDVGKSVVTMDMAARVSTGRGFPDGAGCAAANVAVANVEDGVVSGIFGLAVLIPGIAVAVRRLHDTDRSGWWIFLGLIPIIGTIVLLVFYVQDGTPGTNRYGPDPKFASASA